MMQVIGFLVKSSVCSRKSNGNVLMELALIIGLIIFGTFIAITLLGTTLDGFYDDFGTTVGGISTTPPAP